MRADPITERENNITQYLREDSTYNSETVSKANNAAILSRDPGYISEYNNYKATVVVSQEGEAQVLREYRRNVTQPPRIGKQEISLDETQISPAKIVPFSAEQPDMTSNITNVTKAFYDNSDRNREYDHVGKYVVSSSSNNGNAYKAFNNTNNGWTSTDKYNTPTYGQSLYVCSSSTTIKQEKTASNIDFGSSVIEGEWLQIELPVDKPIYLYKYGIKVPSLSDSAKQGVIEGFKEGASCNDTNTTTIPITITAPQTGQSTLIGQLLGGQPTTIQSSVQIDNNVNTNFPIPLPPKKKYKSSFPKSFTVAGSNNGQDWYYIDQWNFVEPPDIRDKSRENRQGLSETQGITYNNNDDTVYFQVNGINRYTFFRLIVSQSFPGSSKVSITNWSLYGFTGNVSPNINTLESFSNQYVKGMDFSKEVDPKLKQTYIEQMTNINEAKTITNPLSNLLSYNVFENFDSHGFVKNQGGNMNTNDIINNQIKPTQSMYNDYLNLQTDVNKNYFDLSQNIHNFSSNYLKTLNDANDKYDMKNNNFNKPPSHLDGLISDNKEIIMQQNYIFILSTITIATLVLGLIMVSK